MSLFLHVLIHTTFETAVGALIAMILGGVMIAAAKVSLFRRGDLDLMGSVADEKAIRRDLRDGIRFDRRRRGCAFDRRKGDKVIARDQPS